jgi:glyoxylase-like metal-dependent hydrolase (beta-lactamase superfamily II)
VYLLRGGLSWTVPVFFGDLFATMRYRSLLVDPGGPRMRSALRRHLRRLPAGAIELVAVTHAHEEHCGNLALAAEITGAAVGAPPRSLPLLRDPPPVPLMRRLVIGQPRPLLEAVCDLSGTFLLRDGSEVQVVDTPGHCDDHVSLWIPADRLLLAGDGFMGTHFSTPNGDVDHRAWILSLERLIALRPEIMVEGHGHVHTERQDVLAELDAAGMGVLASRRAPVSLLREKLSFLRGVVAQIDTEIAHGAAFDWSQSWSCDTLVRDTAMTIATLGEFGRHKFIRSFQRGTTSPRPNRCDRRTASIPRS